MLGAQAPAVMALEQKVATEEERKKARTPLPNRLQKVHKGLAKLEKQLQKQEGLLADAELQAVHWAN